MYTTSVIESAGNFLDKWTKYQIDKCPECFVNNSNGKLWRECSPVIRQCRNCGAVIDIEINETIVKKD